MKFFRLLNVLNPILYRYKYTYRHNFPADPYQEMGKMIKNTRNKNEQSTKKVLIVPFRVLPGSNLFEGNCAVVLQSRGYQVDALMCGQAVSYCEQIDFSLSKPLRCNLCFHEQKKFIEAFGVNGVFVNQFLSTKERDEIDNEVELVDLNNLKNISYRGVPIHRPLSSALQLYFKKAIVSPQENAKELKGFLQTIFITIRALENYFKQNDVEFVLLSHGVYSTWGTVHEFCLAHSIKFVTWGREYHGAGVIAAHNASYLSEPMQECMSNWVNKLLSENQRSQIIDYLQAKIGLNNKSYDYVDYNIDNKGLQSREELYEKLGLDSEKTIVAMFPSIPWDGQTFRPNIFFDSIDSWIYETIDWFANQDDAILVIRAHPAEKRSNGDGLLDLLDKRYGEHLPKNIILVPPESKITSISIASISSAALLYGSTIGYQTVFLRIPTILASKFFYTNKEITFDPQTKDEYFALITDAIHGNLSVDDARFERLLQYAYHYQFRRIMPETIMNLKGLNFSGYKYSELEELVKDSVINKFIDCCLTGERFYFDECYE
ncbi:hypothetical protein [Legionella hackeliae]|uniref:Capsule polysaccharide biosynthesis protein n=1 Tax=Legionella hackeliae TaxID=449 RepID=A0A0A8UMY5_LEGHA|nr:hypothetical protein [Legionella hackeliae]KTD08802.1 hypothetical protein Lhac_3025 [Legionella hackeliae]CEK10230.1 protein of unknown function [Legionella hackeliae]STX46959.1 Uncharacterised protein [Legionella hackeliae]